jgi:hypothetical protein
MRRRGREGRGGEAAHLASRDLHASMDGRRWEVKRSELA